MAKGIIKDSCVKSLEAVSRVDIGIKTDKGGPVIDIHIKNEILSYTALRGIKTVVQNRDDVNALVEVDTVLTVFDKARKVRKGFYRVLAALFKGQAHFSIDVRKRRIAV